MDFLTVSRKDFWLNEMMKEQYVFLTVILFIGIGAWFQLFNIFEDVPGIWFQRSGSLIVALSLLSEARILTKIKRLEDQIFIATLMAPNIENGLKAAGHTREQTITPWRRVLLITNILLAILGTIIWGYGDIIYSVLH